MSEEKIKDPLEEGEQIKRTPEQPAENLSQASELSSRARAEADTIVEAYSMIKIPPDRLEQLQQLAERSPDLLISRFRAVQESQRREKINRSRETTKSSARRAVNGMARENARAIEQESPLPHPDAPETPEDYLYQQAIEEGVERTQKNITKSRWMTDFDATEEAEIRIEQNEAAEAKGQPLPHDPSFRRYRGTDPRDAVLREQALEEEKARNVSSANADNASGENK